MKKILKYYWVDLAIVLLCIGVLIPVFVIAKYNRPSCDDYDYGIMTYAAAQTGNFFNVIKAAAETSHHFYNVWQGLYTSAFFLSLQPGIYGEQHYAYSTIIIVGFCLLLLLPAVHILNKYVLKENAFRTVSISAVFMTFVTLWLPSPTQGLYWYDGAMNYMPWIFTDLLNVCLLYAIYKTDSKKRAAVLLVFSTVLSFIISGANHVTSFANILYLLVALIILIPKKRFFAIVPFISACVGFVIMYFAPGTTVRKNALSQQPVLRTMLMSLSEVRNLLGDWIALEWLVFAILITPIVVQAAKKMETKVCFWHVAFFTIVSFGVLCAMLCVPYYSMGNFGAGRLTNVIWIGFIMESMFIYFLLWAWVITNGYLHFGEIKLSDGRKKILSVVVTAACFFVLTLIPSAGRYSSSWRAVSELRQNIPQQYCAEMDARIEKYNDPELDEVVVPSIVSASPLLFFDDITEDPNVWPNTSISQYYGKKIYRMD